MPRKKIGVLRAILAIFFFILMNLRFLEPLIKVEATGLPIPVLNCFSMGVFVIINRPSSTIVCAMGALQRSIAQGYIPLLTIGVIILIGATIGRAFCGWVCPLGLLQEALWRAAGKKNKIKLDLSYVQDAILLIVILTVILKGLVTLAILSYELPTYGKIVDETFYEGPFCAFCPSATLLIILPSKILEVIFTGEISLTPWAILRFSILAVFIIASLFTPRPFCRWICPLGVLMGYFNRVSLLVVKRDLNKCTKCGKCLRNCPMKIDITKYENIISKKCIKCLSCVDVCHKKALSVSIK